MKRINWSMAFLCGLIGLLIGLSDLSFNLPFSKSAGAQTRNPGVLGGDLSGNSTNATVVTVGGASASNIASVASRKSFPVGKAIYLPDATMSSTSASQYTANTVYVIKVTFDADMIVNYIGVGVNTGLASTHTGVGIYSADGNTRIIDSGPLDTSSSGSKQASVASVTLSANTVYYYAFTTDSASGSLSWYSCNFSSPTANVGTVGYGTAANASSGGQLPATLGAISPAVKATAMVAKIER